MSDNTTHWGILGPGSISTKFAQGLEAVPDARISAVGSRDLDRAKAFADNFNAPNAYGSYEALVADPEVDVIYIGTPHSFHKDHTLLCLNAGKHVLCEKPFAINAAEAQEMVTFARKSAGVNPEGRLFKPALGGGALLDVGIYPLSLAHMVLGTPDRITSMAELGSTGVDEQTAFILGYDSGPMAVLSTAIRTNTPQEATFIGTSGWIKIHSPWWISDTLTIKTDGGEQMISCPLVGNGYNYEAVEVGNCIQAGKLESDIMPLDETLALIKIMDQIRAQIGLKYPME